MSLGPLEVSPHGIGIALGYLVGAQLMVRRSRRFGGPDENDIWNALFWALLGAIAGARIGYVIGHFSEVTDGGDDLLGIFRIWEGGISLLGGITGAILAALPYVLKKRMGFWRTLDLAAPGLALGIVIGRIGDLMIGDHLGKPTTFALGWRCSGSSGNPPQAAQVYRSALEGGEPPSLGCFDLVLHQTALYDFFSTILLLSLLLWVGRKSRNLGMLSLIFVVWYGIMRVITDFLRVDRRYLGLTGSQLLALTTVLIGLFLLARYRGAPPRFATAAARESPRPPDPAEEPPGPDAQGEREPAEKGRSAPPPDSP